MKLGVFLAVTLTAVYCSNEPIPPKVQVYSLKPGKYAMENILICHVSGFHPPDISVQLIKDGVELPSAVQTDLTFRQDWKFHLTKSVAFTPLGGEEYSCRVTHGRITKSYTWESNM